MDLIETEGIYRNFNYTSFWLGSGNPYSGVYEMLYNGYIGDNMYSVGFDCGVRPVIIIPESIVEI